MRLLDFQILKKYIRDIERSRDLVVVSEGLEFIVKDIRKSSWRHSKTILRIEESGNNAKGVLIGIHKSTEFIYLWSKQEENDLDLYEDLNDITKHLYSEYSLWWTTIESIPASIIHPVIKKVKNLLDLEELEEFLSSPRIRVSFVDFRVVGFVDRHPVYSLVSDQDFGEVKVVEDIEIVTKASSKDGNDIIIGTSLTSSSLPIPSLNTNSTFSGIRIKGEGDKEFKEIVPVFLKVYLNGVLYTCNTILINKGTTIVDNEGKEYEIIHDSLCCKILSRSFSS